MSTAMEHEDIGAEPYSEQHNMDNWSSEPFEGAPSTAFVIGTPNGATIPTPHTDFVKGPQKGTATVSGASTGTISPVPTTAEFINLYDSRTMVTDLLMVSFIPDDVSHADFCDTMDRVQRHLKVQRINNYYQTPTFATKFPATGPASWADDGFSYPEEHHNSFLLRLGGQLSFSATGHPNESKRPMVFSLPLSPVQETRPNRWLVIQPVPTNFAKLFLRPPMAVWRGIGLDASMGNTAAALQLVTSYVADTVNAWRAEDPNCEWATFSFVSTHKVDIKPPPKAPRSAPDPQRQDRGGGRSTWHSSRSNSRRPPSPPSPSEPGGQTQAQYGELFIITVCTAPIGRISHCFDSLIPQTAAYGLPTYPIRLCGWWVELARGLDVFRTNDKKVGPSIELLTPCPTLRIKGLKAGATLGRIIEALGTDCQDASGIQAGFIHRAPSGDSCTLITTGPRLLGTLALRPLATSHTPMEESDIEDLRRLRDRYGTFRRSLGLPIHTLAGASTPPSPCDTALALRSVKPSPPTTFNEIVRSLPSTVGDQLRTFVKEAIQQEVAVLNQHTLARVEELEAAHRQQEAAQADQANTIAGLSAEQAKHSNALLDLDAGQETLRDTMQETRAAISTTAAEVHSHSAQFAGLQTFLERQDARWTRIESSIQTLFKRRGTDFEDDGPPPPPSPGQDSQQY